MNKIASRKCPIKYTWWMIALLIVGWSFIGERWYFDFTQIDAYGCKLYIAVKILFCVASFIACYYLKQFKLSELIFRYRDAIRLAMPIIIVYIVMLLLFYPGIWIGDDMYTLECTSRLSVPWIQGLMITVWDMFWMMLIPIPAFLVLLQQIILIGIAIKIFTYVDSSILNSSKRYIVCIPFLLPTTMYYMLFTHRSSTVALLELIVALGIICRSKKKGFNVVESCVLGVVIAIIPGMRTETYIIATALIIGYILKYGIHTHRKQVMALIASF